MRTETKTEIFRIPREWGASQLGKNEHSRNIHTMADTAPNPMNPASLITSAPRGRPTTGIFPEKTFSCSRSQRQKDRETQLPRPIIVHPSSRGPRRRTDHPQETTKISSDYLLQHFSSREGEERESQSSFSESRRSLTPDEAASTLLSPALVIDEGIAFPVASRRREEKELWPRLHRPQVHQLLPQKAQLRPNISFVSARVCGSLILNADGDRAHPRQQREP